MGRKANGEGSIAKLPSGNYRLRTVDEVDGLLIRKSFTASSPTACRKAHKAWLASENKVAIERVKTVSQWAEHWLEVYCQGKVSESTFSDYSMYIRKHILPAIMRENKKTGAIVRFGDLNLNDVRPAHIAILYKSAKNKNGMPLSRSAMNNIRICLNAIFKTAMDNSLCKANPVQNITLPEKPPRAVKVFKRSHIKQIVAFLDEDENGPIVAFLLFTGLRIGELAALSWADIDADNQTIQVHRTLTRTAEGKKIKENTKTNRHRIVVFDSDLEKYLQKIPREGFYIFCREDGNHHTHSTLETRYKKFFSNLNEALAQDGAEPVPYLSPHKCRHTYATYMLRSGADIRAIQTLLGHTTLKTTEIYTEVDVDDLKDNVRKLKF